MGLGPREQGMLVVRKHCGDRGPRATDGGGWRRVAERSSFHALSKRNSRSWSCERQAAVSVPSEAAPFLAGSRPSGGRGSVRRRRMVADVHAQTLALAPSLAKGGSCGLRGSPNVRHVDEFDTFEVGAGETCPSPETIEPEAGKPTIVSQREGVERWQPPQGGRPGRVAPPRGASDHQIGEEAVVGGSRRVRAWRRISV